MPSLRRHAEDHRQIIAAIENPAVIANILVHLGLSARAPVQTFALVRTA